MEDTNIGFDPLESLGNDYGKINDEGLDTKSFQPFEGDRIDTHEINFAAGERFYPISPAAGNLDRPNLSVRNSVAQSLTNTPKKKADIKDVLKAFGNKAVAQAEASQSKDDFAKIYAYDAGVGGAAFYKRYAAYGQEKFDAIGFHPLRDNEANFNARTTKLDDWSRMMNHSFWPLFGQGFRSAPESMGKLAQWDFSSDTGQAEDYEEAAAIGQSSKGGVFGFVNNTALNFGYTAGIIVEAVTEELVGLALAAPTGGSSLFAATANNLAKGKRLIGGVDKAVDGMKAVNETISSLKNFSSAKTFWSASKGKLGNILNPLDNTYDAIQGIKKADNLTSLAKVSRTAGGFYRDVRNLNMALAEGRLEAGMVQNSVYDKLYSEYYLDKGEPPSDQDQQYMIQQAKEASANTLLWNTGLIYLSNKITFDNITGPKGGLRNFMKNKLPDIQSVGGGKFGDLGKIVYDSGKKAFEFKKNNLKNLASSWWKNPGYKTAAKTIGYMKGNFSEGIQENLQEVIARVNERYYVDTFNSKARRSHEYAKGVLDINKGDYFKEELRNEFSTQGLETFASGFIMGMPAGALNNAMPFLSTSYNKIFDQEGYKTYKENKAKITEGIVESLNKVDINDFLKSRAFNYGAQEILSEIKQSGTKKEALDQEIDSLVGAMETMMETNTADVFIEKLRSYNDFSDEEFMDAMGNINKEDIPKYRERVNASIAKIERIKKRYDFYNEKMPNPVQQSDFEDMDKSSEEYADKVSLYHGWNKAIYNAVYFNESFEDNMSRMVAIQEEFLSTTLLKKTGQTEMNLLFRPDKLNDEVDLLTKDIDLLSSVLEKTDADKKKIKDKKKLLSTLSEFKNAHAAYDQFYNRSDYYQVVKAQIKKNKAGVEPTEEEVNKAITEHLGDIEDETKQVKLTNDLKIAFYEYIKHIADVNDDTAFHDNLDKGINMLLDHYKLGVEARQMVKYINTLHDPNNFADVSRRNQEWMRKLYANRPEYYEAMINQELDDVEFNALLNVLASKNIYVSKEEFRKWKEEGTMPTEFFDNSAKKVIPYNSNEYAMYVALFQQASNLNDEKNNQDTVANKIYTKELTAVLDKLNEEEAEKIANLPTVPVKTNARALDKKRKKNINLKLVSEQLNDKDYIIAEYLEDKEVKDVTIYKDGDILKYDDINGAELTADTSKLLFVSGAIYSLTEQASPDEIAVIKKEYAALRKSAVENSKAKDIVDETDNEDLSAELQGQLFEVFSNRVENDPKYATEKEDDVAFDLAFEDFIKNDPEALEIINNYNKPKVSSDGLTMSFGEQSLSPEEQGSLDESIKEIIANKEFIKLSDDGVNYVNTKTGKTYTRVTNYISDTEFIDGIKKGESIEEYKERLGTLNYEGRDLEQKLILASSQIIGTKVDSLVRDFFTDELKDLSEYDVSSLDNVTTFLARLDSVRKIMNARGEKVLANDIVLYNDELGIAGTVDLLTYDSKGNIRIYDMKTMRGDQFTQSHKSGDNKGKNKYTEPYETGKDSNKIKHTKQLSIYRILLNNTHNLKALTIAIMPIEIGYNPGDTSTTKLNLLQGIKLEALDKVKDAELIVKDILKEEFGQAQTDVDPRITKIEEKRKESLNSIEFISADFDHYIVPSLFGSKKFTFKEQAEKAVNIKYDEELAALDTIPILEEDVETNVILIAKKDIIIKNSKGVNVIFAKAYESVIKGKEDISKGTVHLTRLGNKRGKTFKISELTDLFNTESEIMDNTVTSINEDPLTNEDKDIIQQSQEAVDDIRTNNSRRENIENQSEKLSVEELEDIILKLDLDC